MTIMRKYLILIFSIFLMYSCSTYYYYPTYQDIPTDTKKNEIRGSSFLSGDNEGFNVGYSISENIGTFLTLNTFNNFDFKNGVQIADIGLYYYDHKSLTENGNITYSISSAYGYGQDNRNNNFDLDINRIFIQPSLAFTSKFVDFGISSRFSYVDYRLYSVDYYSSDLYDVGKRKFFFFEPHIFLGLGYKGIKLNYHIANLFKINTSEILYFKDEVGYLSLSLKFDINKLIK